MADIAKAICSLAAKFAGSSVTETSDIADAVTLVKNSYTAPEGLPAVTAADNGKVLGVSDGEWGAVAASGGGVVVIPTTGVYNDDTEQAVSYASISADAVPDALAAGKTPEILVTFNIDDGEGNVLGTFKVSFRFAREAYTVNESGATISGYAFLTGITDSTLAGVTVGTDGSITVAH